MNNELKIIGAAFGNPVSEGVFSGVAKYLFEALSKHKVMAGSVNTCMLSPVDVFDGLIDWSKIKKYGRPGINSSWVWRKKTVQKLSKRVRQAVASKNDFNVFLQIGTHVAMHKPDVRHYCLTDMTVAQAANANQFSIAGLSNRQISEAIEVQREIFENCDGIFVNSTWTKNSIINDYQQKPQKVHVVGVGASVNPTQLSIMKKPAGHNILFVGRDWQRKGGPMLAEAFSLVKEKIGDATLTIIGTVPDIEDPNIKILGELHKNSPSENTLLEKAFCDAAVFCVPSFFEPFGICFLEAQLYGVPPITFDGEGRADAIQNGITGILVKQRTARALSEAIITLLNDTEKIRQMGLAGQEFVSSHFTWDSIGAKVLQIIQADNLEEKLL